jgi:hypothetical protein
VVVLLVLLLLLVVVLLLLLLVVSHPYMRGGMSLQSQLHGLLALVPLLLLLHCWELQRQAPSQQHLARLLHVTRLLLGKRQQHQECS